MYEPFLTQPRYSCSGSNYRKGVNDSVSYAESHAKSKGIYQPRLLESSAGCSTSLEPLPPLIRVGPEADIATESYHQRASREKVLLSKSDIKTEIIEQDDANIGSTPEKRLPPMSSLLSKPFGSKMQSHTVYPALDLRVSTQGVDCLTHAVLARRAIKRNLSSIETQSICAQSKVPKRTVSERNGNVRGNEFKNSNHCAQSSPSESRDAKSEQKRNVSLAKHHVFDPYTCEKTLQSINDLFTSVNIESETFSSESDSASEAEFLKVQYYSPVELAQYWRAVACTAQRFEERQPSLSQGTADGATKVKLSPEQHAIVSEIVQAYNRQLETCDEGLHPPLVNTNEIEQWPPRGQDASHWRHLQERIARQTFAETQFVLHLSAIADLMANELDTHMDNCHLFGNTILMASREWFDPVRKKFRYFWNWKFPEDHPLAPFCKRITYVGRQIFNLHMDASEVALLSALNIVNPYNNDLKSRKQSLRGTHTILKLLSSHLRSVNVTPSERIPELLAVIAPLRHMSIWYSSLIKNLRADASSLEQTLQNLSQLATHTLFTRENKDEHAA